MKTTHLQPLPPDTNNIEVWYPDNFQLKGELRQAAGVANLAAKDEALLLTRDAWNEIITIE